MKSWTTQVSKASLYSYTDDTNRSLVAGQDAVSAVLQYIIRQLSIHQGIQSHLRLKLLTLVPLDAKDRDFAMIDRLAYLNAVVMESLRLVDTVASYQTRTIPQGGRVICGAFLPAGVSTHLVECFFEAWRGSKHDQDSKKQQSRSIGDKMLLQ